MRGKVAKRLRKLASIASKSMIHNYQDILNHMNAKWKTMSHKEKGKLTNAKS